MLRCGRMAAVHNVPVLGVNLGRLGFLAKVRPHDWKGVLARILVGDYWVEERMMLHAEHYRGEELIGSHEILNEVVVSRGALARLQDGDTVSVQTSSLVTRFVRVQDPSYFYHNLTSYMSQNRSADKFK